MAECLFCDIDQGRAPADFLYRDDQVFVIRDKFPAAPTHLLVIPHQHIAMLAEAKANQERLLGHLFLVAEEVAQKEGLAPGGYRLAMNQGANAGMHIAHLHLHVLGGRQLGAMG